MIFKIITAILLLPFTIFCQEYRSNQITSHIFIKYQDRIINGENSSTLVSVNFNQKKIAAELTVANFQFTDKKKGIVFSKDVMESSKFPKNHLSN